MARAASTSSTTANGGSASTLNGTTGMRSRRPSGLGTCGPSTGAEAHGADRDADPAADVARDALDLGERATELGRGASRRVSSGRVSAPRARP